MKKTVVVSRKNPYGATAYFENFYSVVKYLFSIYNIARKFYISPDMADTVSNFVDMSLFPNKGIALSSDSLNLLVPIQSSDSLEIGDAYMAAVANQQGNMKLLMLLINIDIILNDKFKSEKYFASVLAHELQHLLEYGKQQDVKETSKNKKWYKNISPKIESTGINQFKDYAMYFNDPKEIRAKLAELLQYYRVHENKDSLKKYIQKEMEKGVAGSSVYHKMIDHFFSQHDQSYIEKYDLNYMDFISPVSYKYLIKGLYDAINN